MTNKTKAVCSYASITGKNAKSVDQLIASAISSVKSMREKVQVASVAVLMHAEKCGDYTKAQELVDGVGNGVNQNALVEFFVKYGGLIVDEEEGGFNGWKGATFIRDNFQNAKAQPWWELKKQSPYKGFNLHDELAKLLKRTQAANEKKDAAEEDGDEAVSSMISVNDNEYQMLVQLVNGSVA